MSNPVLVLCEDGNTYVLKNQNVYDNGLREWNSWDSMFLQELVVHNVAKYFGIITPEIATVKLEEEIIEQNPTLRFKHRFEPGLHFGSMLIDNVENNILSGYQKLIALKKPYIKTSWTAFFKNITNTEDIPKIIALDLLTSNFDRFSNIGNLMVAKNRGKRKIYAIDHGHCFMGPCWEFNKKSFLTNVQNTNEFNDHLIQTHFTVNNGKPLSGFGEIFQAIDQHIHVSDPEDHSFMEIVEQIEEITEDIIDSWFTNIPDEWYIQKDIQISYYKQYFMKHKYNIRYLIMKMASYGAFNDHTGGELKWKELKTGTQ